MRLPEDLITSRVRLALGAKYDPKADYVVVRPGMVGLPKYASCTVAGTFTEDSKAGGELTILQKPAVITPKPTLPSVERVRSAIAAAKAPLAKR